MSWDDNAPTSQELSGTGSMGWDSAPPTSSELASTRNPSWLDTSLPFGTTPRGIIQGGLNALPTAGMVAGGLAGLETGPGAVVTAGAGGAGGTALKNLGEQYLLGQDKTRSDIYEDPATSAIESAGAEMGGKLVGKGIQAAADTPLGQYVINKAGQAASKVGSAFTGIPQKVLDTYASDPQGINQIAKDADYSSQTMADNLRSNINDQIQSKRQQLGAQISNAFQNRAGQTVDAQPILDALNTSKAQINAKLRPEEIDQVNDLIDKVNAVSTKGQIPLQDAHDLKSWLQEQASGAYSKNGQIFQNGSMAQKAAKAGSAATRTLVNSAAPEVAQANDTLSQLHDIEDTMNRNMLAEGKTGASIYSAGSGENEANESNLKQLGDITGQDFLGDARKIAAAKQFGKAPIMPVDSTGKTVLRAGVAGGLGWLAGGPAGAVVAEGLASPLATKAIINTASLGSKLAQGGMEYAPSLAGQEISSMVPPIRPSFPNAASNMPIQTSPSKGPDKWAQDGFQNLKGHVNDDDRQWLEENKGAMMVDPKAKNLLITGSNFKPGSKPLDDIVKHLKDRLGDDE